MATRPSTQRSPTSRQHLKIQSPVALSRPAMGSSTDEVQIITPLQRMELAAGSIEAEFSAFQPLDGTVQT